MSSLTITRCPTVMYSGKYLNRSLSAVLIPLWKGISATSLPSFPFFPSGSSAIVSRTLGRSSQDYIVRSTDFLGMMRVELLWSEQLR